jgi:thiol-disulfide isomerase/thioredoxin
LKKILMLFACAALAASLGLADSLENVRKAPELSFSLPGKGQQLLSQYRGKVVALEFIFTTCPHCQAASKYMTKLQSEFGAKGLQVIDIAVNANADLLVENFAKDFQVNFPVGWTNSEQMQSFMGFASQRYVVPQLALIDRKGNIHWQTPATTDDGNWEKIMNQDAIRQHIEELLSSGNTSAVHTTKLAAPKRPS